jgi:hypothetical protein
VPLRCHLSDEIGKAYFNVEFDLEVRAFSSPSLCACFENVIRTCPSLPSMSCRGYTPMAEQTLDPDHQSQGDTKEGAYNQFIYSQYANPTMQLACIA